MEDTYWPKEINWRRTSVLRYLMTPDDNCLVNCETYFKCPRENNHSSNLFYHDQTWYLTWFSGHNEGDKGCQIMLSRLKDGQNCWSDPQVISHLPDQANQNSVLYHDGQKLVCIYNTQFDKAGDRTAYLCQTISTDGINWEDGGIFDSVPGTLIRGQILNLEDVMILPYYYIDPEQVPKVVFKSGCYISYNHGVVWEKVRIPCTDNLLEPVVIKVDNLYKFYCRDKRAEWVYLITSSNLMDFSDPIKLELPNNDCAIDLVKTPNYIYLIGNRKFDKRDRGRAPLSLYRSSDQGMTFKWIRDICPRMEDPFYVWRYGEFSYPSIRYQNNTLHISFTYNRKTIKYQRISLGELEN